MKTPIIIFAALAALCAVQARLGDTLVQSRGHYGDPLKVADEPGGKPGEVYALYKVVRNGEELLINEVYLDNKAVAISYYWPRVHDDFTPEEISAFVAENLPADLRDQSTWKVAHQTATEIDWLVGNYDVAHFLKSPQFSITEKGN
jgi:hypothetical protein